MIWDMMALTDLCALENLVGVHVQIAFLGTWFYVVVVVFFKKKFKPASSVIKCSSAGLKICSFLLFQPWDAQYTCFYEWQQNSHLPISMKCSASHVFGTVFHNKKIICHLLLLKEKYVNACCLNNTSKDRRRQRWSRERHTIRKKTLSAKWSPYLICLGSRDDS